jgi:hypothetical protein
MAEAIISGLTRNQIIPASAIIAAGPEASGGKSWLNLYGIGFDPPEKHQGG